MTAIILRGGRVVDPATSLDTITDVLVKDGVVATMGRDLDPADAHVLDVTGLIVGPGFIDLHSHVHTIAGQRIQALDGVTTALDLEAGLAPVAAAYRDAAAQGRPLNFGFSASWSSARAQALLDWKPTPDFQHTLALLGRPEWQRSSSSRELATWLGVLEAELADGALGIGVLLGYAPRSAPGEYAEVAKLAAAAGVPTFTHVRELIEADPETPMDGPTELVVAASETGAAMHHCHVNSTSRRHIDRVLALLDEARRGGSRITLEAYPYGTGATAIGAAFLAPDRLPAWDITPSNLVVVATGERVADVDRLRELQAEHPDELCVVEFLDESDPDELALLDASLGFTDTIVASDGGPIVLPDGPFDTLQWPLPPGTTAHPRVAGTYTKAIRRMVRETRRWSWLEVFRRCSYLPARILDDVAPAMRAKGHLGIGADADIVVIDPETVSDTATFADPVRPPVGICHVFVSGTHLVTDGQLRTDQLPGRGVRGTPPGRG